MRRTALLPLVVVLAACGGGGKSAAPVDTNLVNACAERLYVAGADDKELEKICTAAGRERLVAQDGRIYSTRLLARHHDFYEPLCTADLLVFYGQIPEETSTTFAVDSTGLARRACSTITKEHLDTNGGAVDPATLTRLFHSNPDLGAPILYAGLLTSYRAATGITRADWVRASRGAARRAWTLGVARVKSLAPLDLDIDSARLAALVHDELVQGGLSA